MLVPSQLMNKREVDQIYRKINELVRLRKITAIQNDKYHKFSSICVGVCVVCVRVLKRN